jgi:hypothetical protein
LPKKYGKSITNRQVYLDLYDKEMSWDPGEYNSGDKTIPYKGNKTTWRQLIESNPDITNKALFFASVMDEGGDKFTSLNKYKQPPFHGAKNFGLD